MFTLLPPDALQRIFVYGHVRLNLLANTLPDSFKSVSDRDQYWVQVAQNITSKSLPSTVNWRVYLGPIVSLMKLNDVNKQLARIISTDDADLWDAFSYVTTASTDNYKGYTFHLSLKSNSTKILSRLISVSDEHGLYQAENSVLNPGIVDIKMWSNEMTHLIANSNLVLLTLDDINAERIDTITPNIVSREQYDLMAKINKTCFGNFYANADPLIDNLLKKMSSGQQLSPVELDILYNNPLKLHIDRSNYTHMSPALVRLIFFRYGQRSFNAVQLVDLFSSISSSEFRDKDVLRLFVPLSIRGDIESPLLSELTSEVTRKYKGSDSWVWYAFRLGCDMFGVHIPETKMRSLSRYIWHQGMCFMNRLILHSKDGDVFTPKNVKYMFKDLTSGYISFILDIFGVDEREFYSKYIHLLLISIRRGDIVECILERYGKEFIFESLDKSEYLSEINILQFNSFAFNLVCRDDNLHLLKRMKISLLGARDLYGSSFDYSHHLCIMQLVTSRADREAYYSRLICSRDGSHDLTDEESAHWDKILIDVFLDTKYLDNFTRVSCMFDAVKTDISSLVRQIMSDPEKKALCMEAIWYCDRTYDALSDYLTPEEQKEFELLSDEKSKDDVYHSSGLTLGPQASFPLEGDYFGTVIPPPLPRPQGLALPNYLSLTSPIPPQGLGQSLLPFNYLQLGQYNPMQYGLGSLPFNGNQYDIDSEDTYSESEDSQ